MAAYIHPYVTEENVKSGKLGAMLELAVEKFPRSVFLRLFAAACWDDFDRQPRSVELIRECESLDPALDHAFVM